MSKSDLKEIIEQYECVSKGVALNFKMQWAASEPRWAARRSLYTVAVDVLPEHGGPKTIHLVVPKSTARNALLQLLVDAVETSSVQGAVLAHGG